MSRRQQRRLSSRERFVRFVRALFSSEPRGDDAFGHPAGGLGVREPRRPLRPNRSGAVALEAPPDERRDTWAVDEEDRG
jgi:hypothetical protein